MSTGWKIALGIGCGVLLVCALLVGSCFACFGIGAARLAKEVTTQVEKDKAERAKLELQDGWEFTMGEYSGEITGTVLNKSDRAWGYVSIEFALFDGQGNQVGTAVDNITDLAAGGTWKFKAGVLDANAKTAQMKEITAF